MILPPRNRAVPKLLLRVQHVSNACDRYSFGGFTLDVDERRLFSHDGTVRLAPKAFDLLLALVRRAGQLVSKRELLRTVWADIFVEEGILTVYMATLRKELGDTSRPASYIERVSRSAMFRKTFGLTGGLQR